MDGPGAGAGHAEGRPSGHAVGRPSEDMEADTRAGGQTWTQRCMAEGATT